VRPIGATNAVGRIWLQGAGDTVAWGVRIRKKAAGKKIGNVEKEKEG